MKKNLVDFHTHLLALTEAQDNEKDFIIALQNIFMDFINDCSANSIVSLYKISKHDKPIIDQTFILSKNGRLTNYLTPEKKEISMEFANNLCKSKMITELKGISKGDISDFTLSENSNIRIFPISSNNGCWGFILVETDAGIDITESVEIPFNSIINILRNFIIGQETKHELIKSQTKYKEIAEMLPEIIFETDVDGNFLFLNNDGYETFGIDSDVDLSKVNLIDFIAKENVDTVKAIFDMCIHAEKQTMTQDIYGINSKGEIFPVILRINRVKNGKISGTRGIMINITERKKAENIVKIEHDKMYSLFNSIESPIYVSRFDTNEIIFSNKYSNDHFEKSFVNETCHYAVHSRDEVCNDCYNYKLEEDDEHVVNTEYFDSVSGLYYLITMKSIDWIDGSKVRFKLLTNITEQKLAQTKIEHEKKKFKNLINMIPEPVIACNKANDIIFANDPLIELFKLKSFEELLNKNIGTLFLDKNDFRNLSNMLNSKPKINNAEFKLIDDSGNIILVSISARRSISEDGEHTIYVINDITTKRNVEAFLMLNNNIDKLVRSNSELADSLKKGKV